MSCLHILAISNHFIYDSLSLNGYCLYCPYTLGSCSYLSSYLVKLVSSWENYLPTHKIQCVLGKWHQFPVNCHKVQCSRKSKPSVSHQSAVHPLISKMFSVMLFIKPEKSFEFFFAFLLQLSNLYYSCCSTFFGSNVNCQQSMICIDQSSHPTLLLHFHNFALGKQHIFCPSFLYEFSLYLFSFNLWTTSTWV